jgi:hypothetical protein
MPVSAIALAEKLKSKNINKMVRIIGSLVSGRVSRRVAHPLLFESGGNQNGDS